MNLAQPDAPSPAAPSPWMERLAMALATGLGCGFSPLAPGTLASLAAALLYLPLRGMFQGAQCWPGVLLVAATTAVGVWCAGLAERRFGAKDPSRVVIDEIAGQWLTYISLPFSWWTWALGFLLFRLFDVLKPFPARRLERLPAGWGIMVDDLVAAVYALVVLNVWQRWILP